MLDAIPKSARGKALKTAFVIQYPNGEVNLIPMNLEPVKHLTFDHDSIRQRLQELGVDLSKWDSGDWQENPTFLIERKDGLVILYCKYTGHQHRTCAALGPVVYPVGHKEFLTEEEALSIVCK